MKINHLLKCSLQSSSESYYYYYYYYYVFTLSYNTFTYKLVDN